MLGSGPVTLCATCGLGGTRTAKRKVDTPFLSPGAKPEPCVRSWEGRASEPGRPRGAHCF